jgi:hypothetical protein
MSKELARLAWPRPTSGSVSTHNATNKPNKPRLIELDIKRPPRFGLIKAELQINANCDQINRYPIVSARR